MRLFDLKKASNRKKECLEILRGFISDFDEGMSSLDHGLRLVRRKEDIARFLERDMDLLTPDERYRVYRHIGGFFPQQVDRILAARLHREKDPRCIERLQEIAARPRDEVSKAK